MSRNRDLLESGDNLFVIAGIRLSKSELHHPTVLHYREFVCRQWDDFDVNVVANGALRINFFWKFQT